jgi:hypothetical protein
MNSAHGRSRFPRSQPAHSDSLLTTRPKSLATLQNTLTSVATIRIVAFVAFDQETDALYTRLLGRT